MILLNELQGNIVFASNSKLSGNIQAEKIQIEGDVNSDKLEIAGDIILVPKSKLSGDIQTAKMEIKGNIIYNGRISNNPIYTGPYEVTPSQEAQILHTDDKLATEDIIVNPIPSNYGLITWNGSYLRIS